MHSSRHLLNSLKNYYANTYHGLFTWFGIFFVGADPGMFVTGVRPYDGMVGSVHTVL